MASPSTMLNVSNLSTLLTKNVHPQLYPRLFAMTPNGLLLAYSQPVDIKEVRDQAALASLAWKKKRDEMTARAGDAPASEPAPLETLTIEFDNNNLIVRAVQPNLLLVMVGGVPPNRKIDFRATTEARGDPRYPSAELPDPQPETPLSEKEKDVKLGALHIQRKKIDALTEHIRSDFDAEGFVMPTEKGISS